MKLVVVGTGYVGLVSGTCFAEIGHDVTCIDIDAAKVARLRNGDIPIFEPGLADLVRKNVAEGRLSFSGDLAAALPGARAVFIAVGTPPRPHDGHADLSHVFAAVDEVARNLAGPCVVICKSTVPVGTNRQIQHRLRLARHRFPVEAASNPEFLREGSAIEDFLRPDRVVVGVDGELSRSVLTEIYAPLDLKDEAVLLTDLESAELTKYAANAFLATKLSYINEIADICEHVGANIKDVARGMGLDRRIGRTYLHAGPGYGGSCFPKDTRALLRTAHEAGVPLRVIEAVVGVNDARKAGMASRIVGALGGSAEGKTVAVLGVTFKPNTDDMREAPSLSIIPGLQETGATVRAHDPEGMESAAMMLAGVEWCNGPYEAAAGADAVVIVTEWEEYRRLDLQQLRRVMRGQVLVDLRNAIDPDAAAAAGLRHSAIGIGVSRVDAVIREAAE